MTDPKTFYDRQYSGSTYAHCSAPEKDQHFLGISSMVREYTLSEGLCLEVGCGRGAYQDILQNYVGVDLARTAAQYLHKPFFCCSAKALPFKSETFDCAWTVNVLEHIPDPEHVLSEMRRVLKPGGILYLQAAWQCRPWAADGYPVRPYSDFGWFGKLVKASIPIRDALWFRLLYTLPRRAWHSLLYLAGRRPIPFKYRKLRPNLETFWCSDSDACNSMDPFDAALWFKSRGDECLSHPTFFNMFCIRTGRLIFRKERGT